MSNSVIPWTIVYIPGQNTAVGSLSRLQGIFPTQVGSHFISPGHLLSSIYLGTSSSCFLIGILFCLTFWRELNSLWSFQNEYVYIYIFLMYMYVCVFVYFWKPSTSPPQLSEWRCHKPHIFLILLYFLKILFIYLFMDMLDLPFCTGSVSSCSSWASHRGGFSCCWAQALEQLQELQLIGLVAPRHVGSSWTRDPCFISKFPTTGPPGRSLYF